MISWLSFQDDLEYLSVPTAGESFGLVHFEGIVLFRPQLIARRAAPDGSGRDKF